MPNFEEMDLNSRRVDASLELNFNSYFTGVSNFPKRDVEDELKLACPRPREVQNSAKLSMEVDRMSAEMKKLAQMANTMIEFLHRLLMELKGACPKRETLDLKKRKAAAEDEHDNHYPESISSHETFSCKRQKCPTFKAKVWRAFHETDPSDTSLAVKDGYEWKKYGQKVTRDNPTPRAYYKCSFAPSCPVKKKVQRSAEDPSVVVAVYQGEHNHTNRSRDEFCLPPNLGASSELLHFPPSLLGPSTSRQYFAFQNLGSADT